MGILNNEVFDTIITGEYRNDNGKRICGAYTTVDDGAVLVSLYRFENMLSGVVEIDLSFEEAYEKYAQQFETRYKETHPEIKSEQEVIDKWIAEGKIEYSKTVTRANASRTNLEKARKALSSRTNETKARVLAAILNGNSKTEAANILGVSISTITNNLDKIKCASDVDDLFRTYGKTVLSGVDMARLTDFKMASCDYKAFRKRLADKENVAIERVKEKTIELEHYNKGKAVANKLLKEMEDKDCISKKQPESKSLDSDDDIATIDKVINLFAENPVMPAPVVPDKKISDDRERFFAEKYSGKNNTEVDPLLTARRIKFNVDLTMRVTIYGANNNYSSPY